MPTLRRLGGPAEDLTSEYEVNAEFIKLQLPTGEIDVVVGAPLTDPNCEITEYEGRPVRVETSAEIKWSSTTSRLGHSENLSGNAS